MKKNVLAKLVGGSICVILLLGAPGIGKTQSSSKKIFRIEDRATRFGGSSYILGFAVIDILNKKSSWIRGSVLESSGAPENVRVVGQDPKKRKRTFFTCGYDIFMNVKKGAPPFDKNRELYKNLKVIIHEQKMNQLPITLNPNIKTLADLKGKRVATWPKGTSKYYGCYTSIAGAGKDVLDSIKWQYTEYGGYDDMILGKVDVAWSFWPERQRGKFTTIPKLKELMSKRRIYFVTATKEMRERTAKLFGPAAGLTITIPAGNYGLGMPRHDSHGLATLLALVAFSDMPDEVVYEIVKTIDENHLMIKEYHPAGEGWYPENYGTNPVDKEDWHPGARKYYDEKRIGYGKEYFFQQYPMK